MTYISRHEPWSHQKEALAAMSGREAFALLMAMRTGKTKTLLDDFGRLEAGGDCNDLLVIAPGGVYRTWKKAVEDHLAPALLARVSVHVWETNSGKKQREKLVEFLLTDRVPRILLINIEALSNVERARAVCQEFLCQRKSMLVIDESTAIKNYKAKRTKFINHTLKPLADWRRILTGLPTPKSPLDLYSQFEFLDPKIMGFRTFHGFRARYAIMKNMVFSGRVVPLVVGYRDEEELRAKIAPHSFRVRLEDCYELPPKMYSIREVPLTAEQERIYKELKQFASAQLEDATHVSASIVIAQIIRMHQTLCGHVCNEDGQFVEIPERRTETLLDLLEEHDGKSIIWCSYDADVRKVADAIAVHFAVRDDSGKIVEDEHGNKILAPVARFWGGNRKTREEEEQKFLTDPACRHIVATAAAGGRGRTWTVADLVVYYSNTPDLEHRSQSEERAQGVDKNKSVAYVDLVAPGTVDEKMLKTLRNKQQMAAVITGDNWREWVI